MEKHLLSKSTFLRASQCTKSLWLYKYNIKARDPLSPAQQALFRRGADVGTLARQLFPGGANAAAVKAYDYQAQVLRTQELIHNGANVIYEAAFQHGPVLAIMDILVKENGRWCAYEVKSSARVSPIYIADASLQYFVITGAGIPLADIFIVHVNTAYVKQGRVEVSKLFSKVSVLDEAKKNSASVSSSIVRFLKVLSDDMAPRVKIGEHCFSPYPCDFMGHCWRDVPEYSVFELGGMKKETQFGLYDKGIKKIVDIPDSFEITPTQRMQVNALKTGRSVIDRQNLSGFLSALRYPLLFLDFETFMPAVPVFDGTRPYQHIPFQYSLHTRNSKEGKETHKDFLAEAGSDPRGPFIEALLRDTEGGGDILTYNASFERTVLENLKKEFPQHEKEIEQRISRIRDLMLPFMKGWYYHPEMMGSYSIKTVLPALVPELKHSSLKIYDGSMAMAAFEELQTCDDIFRISEIRESLIEYCKLDTLAMVKILDVLQGAV